MEKFGVELTDQKQGLLQREAEIMTDLAKFMGPIPPFGVKTAQEAHDKRSELEKELFGVRDKIAELDKQESAT